ASFDRRSNRSVGVPSDTASASPVAGRDRSLAAFAFISSISRWSRSDRPRSRISRTWRSVLNVVRRRIVPTTPVKNAQRTRMRTEVSGSWPNQNHGFTCRALFITMNSAAYDNRPKKTMTFVQTLILSQRLPTVRLPFPASAPRAEQPAGKEAQAGHAGGEVGGDRAIK